MKKFKVGVIGNGFVGEAISFAFSLNADVYIYDIDKSKTINSLDSVHNCDFVFICVPTPMFEDGSQDLSYVFSVFEKANTKPIYIIKSTVLPGTTNHLCKMHSKFKIISVGRLVRCLSALTIIEVLATSPNVPICGRPLGP